MFVGELPDWVKSGINEKRNTVRRRQLRNGQVVVRDYRSDWKPDPTRFDGPRDFMGRTANPSAPRKAYAISGRNEVEAPRTEIVANQLMPAGSAALNSELSRVAYGHLYPRADAAEEAIVAASAAEREDGAPNGGASARNAPVAEGGADSAPNTESAEGGTVAENGVDNAPAAKGAENAGPSTAGDGGDDAASTEVAITDEAVGGSAEGAQPPSVVGNPVASTAEMTTAEANAAMSRALNAPASPRMSAAAAAMRAMNADLNELADDLLAAAAGSDAHRICDLIALVPQ